MSSTLELCKTELDKHGVLTPAISPIISRISDAITFNISPHMKAVIAVTQ